MNHNDCYDFISSNIIRKKKTKQILSGEQLLKNMKSPNMIPKRFNSDAKVLKFDK